MQHKHDSYAVVDLEATGTGAKAAIIQVGIVIIEGGQVVETYATDVNPHQPLDQHIKDLTGISDAQLAQAPTFSQVAGQIYQRIAGRTFVAHNVQFDANLLAEHLFLEGFDLRTPRIDTVELAQVCFPTIDKYSLSNLDQHLDLGLGTAHTAINDALATAQLFLKMIDKFNQLPKQTLQVLAGLSGNLIYETGQVIQQALAQARSGVPAHLEVVGQVLVRRPLPSLAPQPMSADFSGNCRRLGLAERANQQAFASLIEEELAQPSPTFIEGQAGLGKTYGYLLPLLAKADGRQVIVAVPTKLLQHQMMTQEGQRLREVFGTRLTSIKSPRHYVDLRRFASSLATKDSNRLINRCKMQVLVWLLETQTGDMDELLQKQGMTAYFERLGHCGRSVEANLEGEFDFWHQVTQQAKASQVIVTNHAFLLASLQDAPHFLTDKVLVVDEAQRFFLAMEASSHKRVDLTQTFLTINQLLSQEQDFLSRRLLESLQRQLNTLVTTYRQSQESEVTDQLIAGLRQDLAEYDRQHLQDLRNVLDKAYTDFWLETTYTSGRRQTDLVGARLDFLDVSTYLTETTKAYFISATVAISKRVALPDLLGLPGASLHLLGNSRADDQLLWIDETMPEPQAETDATYLAELVERLLGLVTLGLPTLVLLTSHQLVQVLSERLEELGLSHLAQGRHGEVSQLKRRFDKDSQPILLATGAFWEGIDFAQHDQLLIVIPKIPFDNPKEPFIKKINRYLKARGKQPFYDYALPVASLRLKQALGRGNRRPGQRSAVLVLDSRLMTKPYGKAIRKNLSQVSTIKIENFAQILSEIQEFCYNGED